jgi:protein gp37
VSENSAIEWTGSTWNPTTGCDQISPGCDNCYAKGLAGRWWASLYPPNPDGSSRTFEDVRLHEDRLGTPLKWAKGQRIFVDSMSDLFHDEVPPEFIGRVFNVMGTAMQHQFQVLTKRPKRMRDVVTAYYQALRLEPFPNVWLGTSIELDRYVWRANYLREAPAAIRFISAEPLLGPLPSLNLEGIDWLITGGESGSHHRPIDPAWVRDLRDRCTASGVAFFHKQWGGRTPKAGGRLLDGCEWNEFPEPRKVVPA